MRDYPVRIGVSETVTLSVHANFVALVASGGLLAVNAATENGAVVLSANMNAGQTVKLPQNISRIKVTNNNLVEINAVFLLGNGSSDVVMADGAGGDGISLSGLAFNASTSLPNSGVDFVGAAIFNPSGSGKRLKLYGLTAYNNWGQPNRIYTGKNAGGHAAIGVQSVNGINNKIGESDSAAYLVDRSNVTMEPTTDSLNLIINRMQPSHSDVFIFDRPIILTETAFVLNMGAQSGMAIDLSFDYIEELL